MDEMPTASPDERNWGMFCHLAALAGWLLPLLGCIIGPLVIWLLKKDQYPFVNDQGKEALNFQITMLIAMLVAGLSVFVLIGMVLLPALVLTNLVFIVIATVQASKGIRYRYPYSLRLIK